MDLYVVHQFLSLEEGIIAEGYGVEDMAAEYMGEDGVRRNANVKLRLLEAINANLAQIAKSLAVLAASRE